MKTQSRRAVLLYLALIFGAGATFGAVAYRFYDAQTAVADRLPGPPLSRRERTEIYRHKLVTKLQEDLQLSPDQVTEVTAILEDTGQRYLELYRNLRPQIEALRVEQAERVMAILSPGQQEDYHKILERRRLEREKREKECR
jgi:hypothetical protein